MTQRRLSTSYLLGLLSLPAMALASGCTVGPNYRRPETPVPPQFGSVPPATAPTTTPTTSPAAEVSTRPITVAEWWTTLNDPQLDGLIDQAVESSLDLRLATARLREARARRAAVTGGQFPSVDLDAGFRHERISGNSQPFASVGNTGQIPFEWNLYQLGFDANWELDVFGGTRRAVEAAGADVAAGVEGRREVLLSVLAEVARNYVELRGIQRQLEVAEANLKVQRETVEVTRSQRANGVVTQLDVARAAAQAFGTEAQIPALRNQQWQAIHRIAVLLGREPDALAGELSPHKPIPLPPTRVPVGLPSDLLRRRPDIRRAERELAGATARVGVAVADLFPRFSLVATAGGESSDTENLFNWPSRVFNVGPQMSFPIFDAGRLRAIVQVRNAQQDQALIGYQQTVLGALREVEDAITGLGTEQERAKSLADRVASTADAAAIARDQYKQGLTDFLTVLDAQRSLYQAQDELARSQQAVTVNLIALYKALGGGWEIERRPADDKNVGADVATTAVSLQQAKAPATIARQGTR